MARASGGGGWKKQALTKLGGGGVTNGIDPKKVIIYSVFPAIS